MHYALNKVLCEFLLSRYFSVNLRPIEALAQC